MESSTVIWSLISYFLIGLAYFAALAFALGMLGKLFGYLRTPMPWPEVTTPAPTTEGGAVLRVLGDVTLFPNLFKADKWLWVGAWLFHVGLAAILFRHLRYFTYPVPSLVLALRAGVHSIAPEVYSLLPKFVFRYPASSWFGVQLAGGPLQDPD